ncbi:hypothetical protein FBU59_004533 [Linderina macrospora]|uniref:Uncharacterized protein n=1 Tax=Linderina macrospora TaxID=4868 RepID=A0ACC1J584_9FUNG|nr:hypothetical protein FBU59_004533 [Linderina macrospora]
MTRPFSDGASECTLTTDTPNNTTSLYVILGVDPTAPPSELKRAYRRLALQYHPDRNPGTSHQFVSIQHAYDILSDERMRRIYDRYGDLGIQMAGRMGGELLDPHVSNLLSAFAFMSAMVAMLLIMFFALLARRVDMQKPWPYLAVFMPVWTIDGLVLVAVCWAFCLKLGSEATGTDMDGDLDAPDDNNNSHPGSETWGNDAAVTSDRQAGCADEATALLGRQTRGGESAADRRRERRRRLKHMRVAMEAQLQGMAQVLPVIYVSLLVLFHIVLALRLDGYIHWSALRTALPWLAIEGIHSMLLTIKLLANVLKFGENGGIHISSLLVLFLDTYWWLAIRVSQALLVIMKLDGTVSWSWAVIFVPTYLPALRSLITLCLLKRQLRNMGDPEILQNESAIVFGLSAVFVVVSSFVYSFIALLVWRLSAPLAVRLAIVLVPVFTALSIFCLCCSCLSCVLACGMHAPAAEDEERMTATETRRISSDRLLAPST